MITVVGVGGLICLDRWYEEGGLPGSLWYDDQGLICGRWRPPKIRSTSPLGKLFYVLTTLLTLLCSTLFWVGIFNLVDDYVPMVILNSTYAYLCFVVVGFAMMLATGTLYESSGVESAREELSWRSHWTEHVKESTRALFAIVSQVLLWYGVSSLYWVVCLDGSGCADVSANWWKNLFFMAMGHMMLNATESFIYATASEEDEESQSDKEEMSPGSERLQQAELISRSILAIMAGAMHNIGLWETYDTLIFPGWVDCDHQPKSYQGSTDGAPGGEPVVGSGDWPCWVRNLLFIVIGILMQPNVLILPLLEPDKPDLPPAPMGAMAEGDGDEDMTPKRRARSRSEVIARAQGMNDDLGTARRQRYGSTRMTLISTMPAPSRRKAQTASFEMERRRRQKYLKTNNVLAAPKARTQSEQGASPGSAATSRRRAAMKGRGLMRDSLKDKLMTTSNSSSDSPGGFGPNFSRSNPLMFESSAGGKGGGSVAMSIPESKMEESWEDTDAPPAVATSLPTPRTLRLLTDERFLKEHFPEQLAARSFAVGERVEADWNSFGNWYSGVIASVDSRNQYTVKYDDDSVEKDVPAVLVRPARGAISEMGAGLQLGAGKGSATMEAPAYEAWAAYSGLEGMDDLSQTTSAPGVVAEGEGGEVGEGGRPIRGAEFSFKAGGSLPPPAASSRRRGGSEVGPRRTAASGGGGQGQVNRGRAASAELAQTTSLPTLRE